MRLGIVKWIDAVAAGDEWVETAEGTEEVVTVGLLEKETETYITMVLSKTQDGLIRGYISIPKSCIVFSKFENI